MVLLLLLVASLHADEPMATADLVEERTEQAVPSVEVLKAMMIADGYSEEDAVAAALQVHEMFNVEASLEFLADQVVIADGKVTVNLPENYRYLSGSDASRVLEAWGNLPDGGGLGMIVPHDVSLFSEEGWAVLITYEEEGYVDDSEASTIDWAEMLVEMKANTETDNVYRRDLGIATIHLEEWADPPHYDAANHRLYWATVLISDEEDRTLNYDIRVLGRRGVLQMSAIATIAQLDQIKSEMENVITFASFNDGHRYDQFDPDLDTVAAYGIGALVAGKVASNAGVFAALGALLLKGKKLLIFVAIGAIAFVRSLFGRGGSPTEGNE